MPLHNGPYDNKQHIKIDISALKYMYEDVWIIYGWNGKFLKISKITYMKYTVFKETTILCFYVQVSNFWENIFKLGSAILMCSFLWLCFIF